MLSEVKVGRVGIDVWHCVIVEAPATAPQRCTSRSDERMNRESSTRRPARPQPNAPARSDRAAQSAHQLLICIGSGGFGHDSPRFSLLPGRILAASSSSSPPPAPDPPTDPRANLHFRPNFGPSAVALAGLPRVALLSRARCEQLAVCPGRDFLSRCRTLTVPEPRAATTRRRGCADQVAASAIAQFARTGLECPPAGRTPCQPDRAPPQRPGRGLRWFYRRSVDGL